MLMEVKSVISSTTDNCIKAGVSAFSFFYAFHHRLLEQQKEIA
jgi:hypothetical protein